MQKIIDAHVHLSERGDDALIRFARMNGLRYTMDELLGTMREHKIVRGLLLSPPLQGSKPLPNDEVIALCEKSDAMLVPVITVEPTAKGDTAFSTGDLILSHPLTLDRLANKREQLTIVLCHFGNPWFDDVAELIYKHPNVYADISGLITPSDAYADKFLDWLARKISEAIYYAGGAEKVIFGTDYPVTTHTQALALVSRLEIAEGDKEKILWRNAEKVFRL